jgi:hypothetical protein
VAKKDIKENFFTGSEPEAGVGDAWRCDGCNQLIYNVSLENGHAYPRVGAPFPAYLNLTYKKVCAVCLLMYNTINDSNYFRALSQNSTAAKKVKQKEWEGMG